MTDLAIVETSEQRIPQKGAGTLSLAVDESGRYATIRDELFICISRPLGIGPPGNQTERDNSKNYPNPCNQRPSHVLWKAEDPRELSEQTPRRSTSCLRDDSGIVLVQGTVVAHIWGGGSIHEICKPSIAEDSEARIYGAHYQ